MQQCLGYICIITYKNHSIDSQIMDESWINYLLKEDEDVESIIKCYKVIVDRKDGTLLQVKIN